MADFAPPTGPPPPKVPEGWKAIWNDQYSEWFYVNIYTKKSQWDRPTSPVYPPGEAPPEGAPPSYTPSSTAAPTSEKNRLSSNNPYSSGAVGGAPSMSEDERLARKLQEEEEARARGHSSTGDRGLADAYYKQSASPQPGYGGPQGAYPPQNQGYGSQSPYPQQSYGGQSPYPPQNQGYGTPSPNPQGTSSKGGFLSKLMGGKSGSRPQGYGSPMPQPGYGGGYGQPAYGGQPGYYPQQGMYGQPARKKPGMGVGGAAALGVGGGLLGGALLANAFDDDHDTYVENNYYGDDGGDFGGDDGGGDFGGDF